VAVFTIIPGLVRTAMTEADLSASLVVHLATGAADSFLADTAAQRMTCGRCCLARRTSSSRTSTCCEDGHKQPNTSVARISFLRIGVELRFPDLDAGARWCDIANTVRNCRRNVERPSCSRGKPCVAEQSLRAWARLCC
jgi:hypothetical protein